MVFFVCAVVYVCVYVCLCVCVCVFLCVCVCVSFLPFIIMTATWLFLLSIKSKLQNFFNHWILYNTYTTYNSNTDRLKLLHNKRKKNKKQ